MLLWEALLVGALFGGLLLSFLSMRGSPSPPSACHHAETQNKKAPPPALRPPGTPTGGTGERRKSVSFVPHSTPPSQRRQRQAMQEALAQRSIQLWERSDLAERRQIAEKEERVRREEETQRRSLAAEETKRIIGAILSSPICTGSEHDRWERDGAGARRRSSVDSGFSARLAVPKREWRTRSDEVHRHHQPHQHQTAARHQAGSGDSGHEDGSSVTTATTTTTAVEGEGDGDGEEETDILVYIQKALKREQDEVNRIEEELRKIEEENLQIEAELSQGSDSDEESSDGDADQIRCKTGDHDEEYESGEDDREDDGEWGQAEMEEEMRSMEDEIQMIEEEQRFLEEENRKIEQELREDAEHEQQPLQST